MPGFVYFMAPQGDRMIALGFDQQNTAGPVTLSLFDVADMKNPKMLSRVNFGAGWGWAPEDQDRIHKALNILADQHMILMPFSSYSWQSSDGSCYHPTSGVQIVDWNNDALTLRGLAPLRDDPRRAFLVDSRLFAVSDDKVATFDITDRDHPAQKAEVALANESHHAVVAGDYVVQLSHDWWTSEARVIVTPKATADDPTPLGSLDLTPLAFGNAPTPCTYSWYSWYEATLFANGHYVYVVAPPDSYYYYGNTNGTAHGTLGVIDIADPTAPKLVGQGSIDMPVDDGWYGGGWYGYGGYYGDWGLFGIGADVVQVGSTAAILWQREKWDQTDSHLMMQSLLLSIDFADPTHPHQAGTLDLGGATTMTRLQVAGNEVLTSHAEAVANHPGRVRFYLDRIDLSNPALPRVASKINVPGSLLAFDAETQRAVTVDYVRERRSASSWEECSQTWPRASFDYQTNTCTLLHRSLNLVDVGAAHATYRNGFFLDDRNNIGSAAVGEDRIYLANDPYYYYYYGPGSASNHDNRTRLMTIDGMRAGWLRTASIVPVDVPWRGWLWASGDKLAMGTYYRHMFIFDAADATKPVLQQKVELAGYYSFDVTMNEDAVYASLAEFGLQRIPLH